MMNNNIKKRVQAREARLPIIADLYKKGYSLRKIREEVNTRLDMNVSLPTIHKDVKRLLEEWRSTRMENIEDYISLELARIDDCLVELWEQWEKSKENYTKSTSSRKGVPVEGNGGAADGEGTQIVTVARTQSDTNVVALGNPAYMSEIRQQLIERRKLLGLYAPEKKELSGAVVNKVETMTTEEIEAELSRIKKAREHTL